MPLLASLTSAAAWHVLSYGTLLGSQFYQSFIGGVVAFRALPRPMFGLLQQRIFPVYFSMQIALPLAVLLSHPTASYDKLMATEAALPMLITFATSAVNLVAVGPATTAIMRERKAQESKEGRKYYDEGEKSLEMKALNKRFGVMHGVSSLLNLAAFVATVAYGFTLAQKLVM
ncbi:hypothetical protein BZA05DRAFT_31050 [Tricharina praecox]|uniref:uncharacterized protein n=1 Tax=Tricharina praecox TaxID=43433 RepID=UPI00221F7C1F|nr:uncharacterized protein BZA05DRAFT_31050 [Tricharina praecox]KAI5853495.1 hypothetical protein BZA05DRAFT_31050 [Tricharina praecox]